MTRVAVSGASGQLGIELVRALTMAGAMVLPLVRPGFDLEGAEPERALENLRTDIVINAAAWTDVDACARDPQRATAINGAAVGRLAGGAEQMGARFVQISTNEVFDGASKWAYQEDDEPHPINAYGASKLVGERAARVAAPGATIVRTAWIYGGPRSFPTKIRAAAQRAAGEGAPLRVVADEVGNPTPAALLADRIVALLLGQLPWPPIIHLAGEPAASRHDWAARILSESGFEPPQTMKLREYVRASPPPLHAVLSTGLSVRLGLERIDWRSDPG